MTFKLRDYQRDSIKATIAVLKQHKIAYMAMQPRVGKSIMSIITMSALQCKKVLVISTGKALPDVKKDCDMLRALKPEVIGEYVYTTYQSAYKLQGEYFDGVILDEGHNLKAYNQEHKIGKFQGEVKRLLSTIDGPHLLMSGTPAPENELGYYRQFWCSKHHPWSRLDWNQWHRQFGRTTYETMGDREIPKFHPKAALIEAAIKPYVITLSQQEAGFKHTIVEHDVMVPFCDEIFELAMQVKRSPYVNYGSLELDCNDPSGKRTKFHMLCGGMVAQGKEYVLIDDSKIQWIRKFLALGKRIAVYYYFIHEGQALREQFKGMYTDDVEEYASGQKQIFFGQVKTHSCGVRLASADALIVYSMDYSATNYLQWKDRLTHLDRDIVNIYYLFNDKLTMDQKVYQAVSEKKSYTLKMFERDELDIKPKWSRI